MTINYNIQGTFLSSCPHPHFSSTTVFSASRAHSSILFPLPQRAWEALYKAGSKLFPFSKPFSDFRCFYLQVCLWQTMLAAGGIRLPLLPLLKNKDHNLYSFMTFSCSSSCPDFCTQTRHPYPEEATEDLKAKPSQKRHLQLHESASKPFPFFIFPQLVSPDLCLNLCASKGFTTSLLYAQQCNVRQPGSQINPHYGNSENYKGNYYCLERNGIMRLDLSTRLLVRFRVKVQLSAFCLLWQHYYRLSGNLILQAEDRLTSESRGILHPYLQEHNSLTSVHHT